MAKTCLGIDIGREQLKLVLMKGETIQKSVSVQMPDGLFKDGRIVSVESTGELIRQTMKENKIRCTDAAVVIPYAASYLRNVAMPKMTPEQMMYNLPYEFRDYISDELKKYAFDYIQYKKTEEEENDVLAIAVPLETLEDLRLATRKAGLRLRMAAPEVSACEALLYRYLSKHPESDQEKEYGILDLGSNSSRLMIFKGYRHQVTRTVEQGMDRVEELLADHYHIDIHLAHAWLLSNHEDCVNSEVCQDAFSQISVEIMRALNFYQFSNPGSQLEEIWVGGSSVATEAMKDRLRENVDVNILDASELLEGMANGKADLDSVCFQAVGIGLNQNVTTKDKCINLAMAGVEKKHYALAFPALVAIAIGAGAIAKFAVADRLIEVSRQQSQVTALQQQVDAANAYIESLGDLQDTYAHYTYQGFTTDEIGYMNRPDVMKLLQDVIFPKVTVGSWSLDGSQLTLPVTGATLEDINQLAQQLNAQDLVEYCTVTTAATDNVEGQAEAVTGQITIFLKTILPDDLQQILGGTDNENYES